MALFGGSIAKLLVEVAADTTGLKSGLAQANRQVEDATKKLDLMGKVAEAVTVVGIAAVGIKAARVAVDLSKLGAQSARLETSFRQLASAAGSSSDDIIASLQSASSGTISDMNLMLSANRAMMLGLGANADQLAQLMEVARFRGRAMGLTTAQAFSDIVTGIGRLSPLILDNLGIVIDSESAYASYADSVGKSAKALSEAEKKQATLAAVLQNGKQQIQQAGGVTDDAADSFEQLDASWANLKVSYGEKLAPTISLIVKGINSIVKATEEAVAANAMYGDSLAYFAAAPEVIRGTGMGQWVIPSAVTSPEMHSPWYTPGGGAASRLARSPQENEQAMAERRAWTLAMGDTSWMSAAAKELERKGSDIGKAIGGGLQDKISSGLSTIQGLMSPTSVTRLDQLETKYGDYKEKWDEPMRRVQDVIQNGASSPWAQQYFGNAQGEQLEMKALQFQRDWGMGLYNQLPLSQDDRNMMQSGLGQAWWNQASGQAQQTQLAGDVYGTYGKGIEEAFGTTWDDTVKNLALGEPVLNKLAADLMAGGAVLDTAIGQLWSKVFLGVGNAEVSAQEVFLNAIAPGVANWMYANGYLSGSN